MKSTPQKTTSPAQVTGPLPKMEERILALWKDKGIFEQVLKKNQGKPKWVFFEGPPTANGRPGIHHVIGRTFKDMFLRYKTMRGFSIERKAGWDTHGLPVELQVEKELGISGKQQIENLIPGDTVASIELFNKKCKESVWKYKDEWERMTQRTGVWLDLQHPYITYESPYIESLWHIIQQLWDKKLLYQGHKVVPHCPRCETTLSSHELAQGYKEVADTSVYIKFQSTTDSNTFFLSWTTTPWTLPGNVGLAVGPTFTYVKVQVGEEFWWLGKERLSILEGTDFTVVEEKKGQELVGQTYTPLWPEAISAEAKQGKQAFVVLPADFVTTSDGTGIVHTAVMYGVEDYELGVKVGLPQAHTVDMQGKFVASMGALAGTFVKAEKTEAEIIQILIDMGALFKIDKYTHDYPFCWRCSTPILYYAKDSWFVAMTQVKDQLIANNETINWIPEHVKHGRFGEWLLEVKDWAFSRERYWGTPLPIWKCMQCPHIQVIGSFDELEKVSGIRLPDPHRPFVDAVTFDCSECKSTQSMKRVPEVVDVWFDSGAMPYAQWHYPFENADKIDGQNAQFPADYIVEAQDQTRGWFYTLLAVATALGKPAPYKNCLMYGHILDKQGKKMSKSKGNVVDPWTMIDEFGVDSLRLYLISVNQPADYKNFDPQALGEVMRSSMMILWNVLAFWNTFVQQSGLARDVSTPPQVSHVMDRWSLARIVHSQSKITSHMDQFAVTEAAREIMDSITDISTWYVRRSRDRFKGTDQTVKQDAADTLTYALTTLAKLMAPFTPFMAEHVYQTVSHRIGSVHLEDWPLGESSEADTKLLEQMNTLRSWVVEGLALRMKAEIKVRQPLPSVTVPVANLDADIAQVLCDELNVKQVECGKVLELNTTITPELRAEGWVREFTRQVNSLRKTSGLTVKDMRPLYVQAEGELLAALTLHTTQIAAAVKASRVEFSSLPADITPTAVKVEQATATIGFGQA